MDRVPKPENQTQTKTSYGNYTLEVTCVFLLCRSHSSCRTLFLCWLFFWISVGWEHCSFQPRLEVLVFIDFPSHSLRDVWPAVTRLTVLEGTCREERWGEQHYICLVLRPHVPRREEIDEPSPVPRVQVSFCGSMACYEALCQLPMQSPCCSVFEAACRERQQLFL